MDTLSAILGLAGVVLLLTGLLGGGFTFSGSVFPTVGKFVRVPCFVTGGLLVLLALGTAFAELEVVDPEEVNAEPVAQPVVPGPVPEPEPEPGVGLTTMTVDVHEEPFLDSPVVGTVGADEWVDIYCTAEGEMVELEGLTSSLWNFVGSGFVPDLAVFTGTNLPVAPLC